MATYTPEQLKSALQRIQENKQSNDPTIAPLYQTVAPKQLSYTPPVDSTKTLDAASDAALRTYQSYVNVTEQQQANREQKEALARAQAAYNSAQNSFVKRGSQRNVSIGGADVPAMGSIGGKYATAKGVGVGRNLATMAFHGMRYTVNRSVAANFQGFLKALWARGYRPSSIGGYNNRNIAGSSRKSLHAYGLAIDIDPGRNPIYYNSKGGRHGLPPNVGALAAKYGLAWGGNWRNTKDYMHFSVPYGGTM